MEERIVVADPVADPQGYQKEMLALLGGEDPVEVLSATAATVRRRVDGLTDDQLGTRPAPGEWSVAELLGHLWDAEVATSVRTRLILTQDRPPLTAYDQDAWSTLPRPPFGELLDAFTTTRAANLAVITGTPAASWERVGIHQERGPVSLRILVETMAGHDRAHLRQLDQTIAAVR